MIDRLIRWSLNNRIVVIALAVAFLVWGSYVISNMPLDVLPDLSAPTVTILVEGRGMVPTEMEALVTFPVESALNGASGVRRVRSATAVGVAVIWVEFDWGQDILRARQIGGPRVKRVLVLVAQQIRNGFAEFPRFREDGVKRDEHIMKTEFGTGQCRRPRLVGFERVELICGDTLAAICRQQTV